MNKLILKPAKTAADCEQMSNLVYAVWQEEVHSALLMAIVKNGGVGLLAWDGEQPIGFCLSFAGLETINGVRHLKQHSHMAAMLPEYRNVGSGARLKWAQRNATLDQQITLMTWTFDPLETRNARMNLHKLGAVCNIFLPNVYGTRDDPFSAGLPTDRFHAHWWLESARVVQRERGKYIDDYAETRPFNSFLPHKDGIKPKHSDESLLGAPMLRMAVPKNFQRLKRRDMGLARAWRAASTEAFTTLFNNGYTAIDLHIHDNHCSYVLTRNHE